MKIVCPACDATYDVPASMLTSPRKMRCARCGGDWMPGAAAEPAGQRQPAPDSRLEPAASVVAPPPPPLEDLVFTPASFTNFHPLPPTIDPLGDTGFEPLAASPAPGALPEPQASLLKPVPPRPPGEADPVAAMLAAREAGGPSARVLTFAWVASIGILLLVLVAGWEWRLAIMRHWPPSARLFTTFGATPPPGA